MYSSRPGDRASRSGTGVFYQAIPGMGADGKSIMTLIPVQLVNGKFVRTQMINPQTHPPTCKFIPLAGTAPVPSGRQAALNFLPTKQPISCQVPLVNALPDGHGTATRGLPLGMPSNTYSQRIVEQQVLPKARVQIVPAFVHPFAVNGQIFTPSANTLSSLTSRTNGLSMIPVCESTALPNNSEAEYICSASPKISPSLGVSKADLKLTPKVSQRSNSPMKWVIEEVNSKESSLDHSDSCPVSPKLFQTAEEGNKNVKVTERVKPVAPSVLTGSSRSESDPQKELIMCDGRVFFAAKKGSFSLPKGSKETVLPTAPAKVCHHKEVPIVVLEKPYEVIDLCNEDNEDDLCQTTKPLAASLDEDNVIFVSYIPPKSESAPNQCLRAETLENETTRSLGSVTEHNKTTISCSDTDRDQLTCESTNTRTTRVASVTDDKRDSAINHQRNTEQQSDRLHISLEMRRLSDSRISDYNDGEAAHKIKMSTDCRSSTNQLTDYHFKKIFGIVADVKIYLPRINAVSSEDGPKEPVQKRSSKDIQETTNSLKEKDVHVQYWYNPQGPDSIGVKEAKLSDSLPGVTVTLSPQAHDLNTEPVVGYVEPIDDDDNLSTIDENNTPNAADSNVQTLNNIHTNTSRMGRARKRTMCPCCVPGSPGRTVKSSLRVEEPERLTWTKDHMSKRGGRQQKLKSNKRI